MCPVGIFYRVLCTCTTLAWFICCTDIPLSGSEDLPIILSLALVLIVVIGLSARLLWTMRRELQSPNEQAIRLRSEKHK